jgi:polar amino acid transport system substrate-binding protein
MGMWLRSARANRSGAGSRTPYLLALGLLVLLTGCAPIGVVGPQAKGSPSASQTAAACPPAATVASWGLANAGQLTVASDAQLPPAEFVDANQIVVGYDIDVATELAKRLCLQVNVQPLSVEAIIPSLAGTGSGQPAFDIGISSLTINDSRRQQVDMIPYFQAGEAVLVSATSALRVSALQDLCGKSVAVEQESTEDSDIDNANAVQCHTNPIAKQPYGSASEVAQHVADGSADAGYLYSPVAGYSVKQSTGKLKIAGYTTPLKPQGIAVRKDNTPLKTAISSALTAIRSDGAYLKILQNWGEQDGAYPPL